MHLQPKEAYAQATNVCEIPQYAQFRSVRGEKNTNQKLGLSESSRDDTMGSYLGNAVDSKGKGGGYNHSQSSQVQARRRRVGSEALSEALFLVGG